MKCLFKLGFWNEIKLVVALFPVLQGHFLYLPDIHCLNKGPQPPGRRLALTHGLLGTGPHKQVKPHPRMHRMQAAPSGPWKKTFSLGPWHPKGWGMLA